MRLGVIVLAAQGCYHPTLEDGVKSDGRVADDASALDGGSDAAADAPPCQPATNDHPDFAVDISAGGRYCVELGGAIDHVASSCSATGGRDLFFEIDLPAVEIVYFDTFGSNVAVVLALYAGACASTPAELGCRSAACAQGVQRAEELQAGPTCVVIDEAPGSSGVGQVVLNVLRGGASGERVSTSGGSLGTSNTCSRGNAAVSQGCLVPSVGPELRGFFTLCPGEVRALDVRVTTCTPAGGLYHVYGAAGPIGGLQVGCAIVGCDDTTMSVILPYASAGLNWLVLDGRSKIDCGAVGATLTW